MNLPEREQLNLFLQQLTQVQASQKDAEADALIREACTRQPDAGYLLVQRAMQLEHALQTMKGRFDQVQAELERARAGAPSSFMNDANAWGKPVATSVTSAPAASAVGMATLPRAQAPAPAAGAASSWGSGILGTVATTAAGVVAGSFLFHGIQNLMGQHGGAGGATAAANTVPPVADNTVINNYYDGSGADEAIAVADAGGDAGGDDLA